jgi:predicted transcriptional regulator
MPKSKLDFFAHVLEAARKGTTRELIASENDACHGLVENSLNLLKDLNLLAERHNSPVSFVTTEKGLQFLQDYSRLTKQLDSDDHLR